jgi:hypothetical protein
MLSRSIRLIVLGCLGDGVLRTGLDREGSAAVTPSRPESSIWLPRPRACGEPWNTGAASVKMQPAVLLGWGPSEDLQSGAAARAARRIELPLGELAPDSYV